MDRVAPVLTVRSVYVALDWYTQLLGFTVMYRNEGAPNDGSLNYAVLAREGAQLHLGLDRDMGNAPGESAFNLTTTDFAPLLEAARDAGATFYIEPGTIPTGQRTFGIRDRTVIASARSK